MFCIVYGTRPEFIKFSPIIRELDKRKLPYFAIHTGQHYSYNMDKVFFDELKIPAPQYNLGSPEVDKIALILRREAPQCVLVLGDTHSTLVGALAANKLNIPIVHVEAGLRGYDAVREEINRFAVDHMSHLCLCPTDVAVNNLAKEGITGIQVGNTIADAVKYNLILPGVQEKQYVLVTLHRPENVDNPARLADIMRAISWLEYEIVFPCHPRTKQKITNSSYLASDPVGYLKFLQLEANAHLIITDSGGVQEEACILGVPCLTVRPATERPETVALGANILCEPDEIKKKAMLGRQPWKHPYGENVAERIVDCLESQFLTRVK